MSILTYRAEDHQYFISGEPCESVTQILQRAGLTRWAGELENTEAMQRGREVHRLCQLFDEDALSDFVVPTIYAGYVESWVAFLAATQAEIMEIEMPVYSTIHRVAGRPDRIVKLHDIWTVVDIKTGPPGPEAALQTAAYDLLYRELHPEVKFPMARVAVQVHADGKIGTVHDYRHWGDGAMFLSALAVARWRQQHHLMNGDHP